MPILALGFFGLQLDRGNMYAQAILVPSCIGASNNF